MICLSNVVTNSCKEEAIYDIEKEFDFSTVEVQCCGFAGEWYFVLSSVIW